MINDSRNTRILAAAILAGCGAITFGLSTIPRGGSPAIMVGMALIAAGTLTVPGVWEHFVAAITLPFAVFRNALDEQRRQISAALLKRKRGH